MDNMAEALEQFPLLHSLELGTGVRKTYIVLGGGLFSFAFLFYGLGMGVLSAILGSLYPLYASFKCIEDVTGGRGEEQPENTSSLGEVEGDGGWDAIEEETEKLLLEEDEEGEGEQIEGQEDLSQFGHLSALPGSPAALVSAKQCEADEAQTEEVEHWLVYWIVFGIFSFLEGHVDWLLGSWMPIYYPLKLLFLFMCFLPQFKGAQWLFVNVVHPILDKHEEHIDLLPGKASVVVRTTVSQTVYRVRRKSGVLIGKVQRRFRQQAARKGQ